MSEDLERTLRLVMGARKKFKECINRRIKRKVFLGSYKLVERYSNWLIG